MFISDKAEFFSRNDYTLAYFNGLAFGSGYYTTEGANWMVSTTVSTSPSIDGIHVN